MSNPWIEPLPVTASPLPIFLAVLTDLPGSKRPSIREEHLELAAPGFKIGWILNGGATFSAETSSGEEPKMIGTWMLEEAARARLARDVCATNGAWDLNKIQIQRVGAMVQ